MSDTNLMRVSIVEEVTFGTMPSANLTDLRWTSESLGPDMETTPSNEVRSDRQLADVARTKLAASGQTNHELSYGAHDLILEAALLSADWSAAVTVTAATISAAAADNSINDSGNGFGSILENQWIRVTGFTTNGDWFLCKVVDKPNNGKLIVGGITLVNEAAGASVTVYMGAQVVNGTQFRSFSIEKHFTDLTNEYEQNKGMAADTLALNVNAQQMVTLVAGWLGKSSTSAAATGGSGYTSAPTNEVMQAVDHVLNLFETSSYTDTDFITFTWNLANNLRQRMQVGDLNPPSLGTGTCMCSGTARMYYAAKTIMDRMLNYTTSRLAIVFKDSSDNAYVLEFPNVKWTGGRRVGGGQNTDVIADMTWMAKMDPTEGITVRIARFPAS